jgi:hypothetical protein
MTLHEKPPAATHWSARTLAKALGISHGDRIKSRGAFFSDRLVFNCGRAPSMEEYGSRHSR